MDGASIHDALDMRRVRMRSQVCSSMEIARVVLKAGNKMQIDDVMARSMNDDALASFA